MLRLSAALLLSACTSSYTLVEVPDEVYEVDGDTGASVRDPEARPPADAPEVPEDTTPDPAVEEPPAEPVLDPPPAEDCDHTSDLVYLIGRDDHALYLFDPPTLSINRLGVLDCNTFASPASMAVARDGLAYVRYSDQSIKEVDLDTLRCRDTGYNDRRTAFGGFGMGFSADAAGGWRETLYVANISEIASLDTSSWQLDRFGSVASQSELTGTADGELWTFLPLERPAILAQVDKQTGARVRTMRLTGFPNPTDIDAFAFAAWGGSFWLFVREYGMGSSTDIYRVDPGPTMVLVSEDIGVDIVGAGVSTCAPTVAP
jgi:hypothetical protein